MEQEILINQSNNQEILINSNDPQLININNVNTQDLEISQNNNQDLSINQPDNQVILIDGGGAVIGITDVLVNGVSVVSGNIAYVLVPTKTSDLINDSHFITSETDPTVPSYVKQISLADINNWNSKQNELVSGSTIKTINNESLLGSGNINIESGNTYTAGYGIDITNNVISNELTSYNDLTDLPTIPDKTSDLLNDSDYVSESELSEVAFTGSYVSLSNTPENLSDFNNDAGYVESSEFSTELATKQDTLVSGTNIKTINSNSILGSGDLVIGGGSATDVQINGTSIVNNNVANIITESAYNSSTNKIATMSDVPSIPSNLAYNNVNNNFSTNQTINGQLSASGSLITTGNDTGVICDNTQAIYPRKAKYTVSNSGNAGIYDMSNSSWIIRSDTSQNVYIPHNLYVTGDLYGGSSANKRLAYVDEIPTVPTIPTRVTFNNEWINATLSNGGGWKIIIPFINPNKTTPTFTVNSCEYFNGASWITCYISVGNTFETFVILNLTGITMPNNEVVLVRFKATLSI